MNIAIIKRRADGRLSIGGIPCPDGKVNVIPYVESDQGTYDRIAGCASYEVVRCANQVGIYNLAGFVVTGPPDTVKKKVRRKVKVKQEGDE